MRYFEKCGAYNFARLVNTYLGPTERESVRLLSKGIALIKHPNPAMNELNRKNVVDRFSKMFSLKVKETPNFYVLTEKPVPKPLRILPTMKDKVSIVEEAARFTASTSDKARLSRFRRSWKSGYDRDYDGRFID